MTKQDLNRNSLTKSLHMKSQCSCPKCDSIECFQVRNAKGPCSCMKCSNSKTCVYFSNKCNMNESKSDVNFYSRTHLGNMRNEIQIKNYSNSATNKPSNCCRRDTLLEPNKSEKNNRSNTRVHSCSIHYSMRKPNTITTDLSAQVMNVPYNDFKNSLAANKSDISYKKNMSKYDILKRIKEVYAACSCKVCECIAGKTLMKNELCKCKPCDCNDCTSYISKIGSRNEGLHSIPPEGCPCIRCNRTQCKGLISKFNEPQICDCEPCDCIKCVDNIATPCDCKPCQCVECKAMSIHFPKFVVAPVGEEYQRNTCECSPCDCIECGLGYGMSSNLRQEMSTGYSRYPFCHCDTCVNEACEPDGNDSCKCQRRNKVVNKPVEKDSHDYDVRAILTKTYLKRHLDRNLPLKTGNNTIAMIATLPSSFPKYENTKKICSCDECECIVCSYKENAADSIKSSQLFDDTAYLKTDTYRYFTCRCQNHHHSISNMKKSSTANFESKSSKDYPFLDCYSAINCDYQTYNSTERVKEFSPKRTGEGNFDYIQTREHNKRSADTIATKTIYDELINYSNEAIYPIKKGKILTPSIINGIEYDNLENTMEHQYSKTKNVDVNAPPRYIKHLSNEYQPCKGFLYKHAVKYHYTGKGTEVFDGYDNEIFHKNTQTINSSLYTNLQFDDIHVPSQVERENTTNLEQSFRKSHVPSVLSYKENKFIQYASNDSISQRNDLQSFINDAVKLNFEQNLGSNYNVSNINKDQTDTNNYFNNVISSNMYQIENNKSSVRLTDSKKLTDTSSNGYYNVYSKNELRNFTSLNEFKLNKGNGCGALSQEMRDVNSIEYNTEQMESYCVSSNPEFYLNKELNMSNLLHNYSKNKVNSVFESIQFINDYLKNDANNQNVRSIYEKAQKTLVESRAYSAHLKTILEDYEKANMEFVSVSQKFKVTDELFKKTKLNYTPSQFHENYNSKKEDKNKFKYELDTRLKKSQIVYTQNDKHGFINDEEENLNFIKFINEDATSDNIKKCVTSQSEIRVMNSLSKDSNRQVVCTTPNDISMKMYKDSEISTESLNQTLSKFSNRKKQASLKCYKKTYSKLLKRTIMLRKLYKARKTKLFNSTVYVMSKTTKHCLLAADKNSNSLLSDNLEMHSICNTETMGETNETSKNNSNNTISIKDLISTIADEMNEKENSNFNQLTVLDQNFKQMKPLSKKNAFFEPASIIEKKYFILPSEEVDEKQANHSISLEMNTNEKSVSYENKALKHLQNEVENLLNMSFLQPLASTIRTVKDSDFSIDTHLNPHDLKNLNISKPKVGDENGIIKANSMDISRMPAIKSPKNSCDAMKVSFQGLKRVSDHTVLVKWNVPEIKNDIQGYELQVDGRSVQKILSPSRNMAVVTCLPHCEKILLTIRTITSAVIDSGHYPSATVIYRPRHKT